MEGCSPSCLRCASAFFAFCVVFFALFLTACDAPPEGVDLPEPPVTIKDCTGTCSGWEGVCYTPEPERYPDMRVYCACKGGYAIPDACFCTAENDIPWAKCKTLTGCDWSTCYHPPGWHETPPGYGLDDEGGAL